MSRNTSRNQSAKKRAQTWHAMDLHLHTPASSDYQEPHTTYLEVLQTAEARGLDIIGFADHNTVAGYRALRDEIAELELLERLGRLRPEEQSRLTEYRRLLDKILLLPGFEFTATFGFHIMGIFPPETPVRDLEHLLLSLNIPRDQLDKGSATVGSTTDVLTAYRLINEAGGLVIAAHANSANGVAMRGFGFGGQTKIAFTQDPHLHALEVTDLEQKGRRTTAGFFNGSKPEYPRRMHCLCGSDAHRLKRDPNNPKNLGVGDRACDVLLDERSFEALRALFEGKDFTRIRSHVARGGVTTEFDDVQQAREEGANIVQAFHVSCLPRGGQQYAVLADVCAFANTNGGTLYIGVPPEAKQLPIGVDQAERAAQELRTVIERALAPRLEVIVDVVESHHKKIIRVQVPRGDDLPYAIDNTKIYVREEAETSVAVRDEIVQLVLRARAATAGGDGELKAPAARAAAVAASTGPATTAAPSTETVTPVVVVAPNPVAPPPRTGVEIVATEVRAGGQYHTMRDLRNSSIIKNVTRASARRLWHYAITAKETGAVKTAPIRWEGDIGLWKKINKGGVLRYDLVQRLPNGELHVYYGVTEDGLHGPWKKLVEGDATPPTTVTLDPSLMEDLGLSAPLPRVGSESEEAELLFFETMALDESNHPQPTIELVEIPTDIVAPTRSTEEVVEAEAIEVLGVGGEADVVLPEVAETVAVTEAEPEPAAPSAKPKRGARKKAEKAEKAEAEAEAKLKKSRAKATPKTPKATPAKKAPAKPKTTTRPRKKTAPAEE